MIRIGHSSRCQAHTFRARRVCGRVLVCRRASVGEAQQVRDGGQRALDIGLHGGRRWWPGEAVLLSDRILRYQRGHSRSTMNSVRRVLAPVSFFPFLFAEEIGLR